MAAPDDEARMFAEVGRLVDEYRVQCLWFLRPDFYPRTDAERLRALDAVARHGDLRAFRRASHLRQWLLQHPSEPSVAS